MGALPCTACLSQPLPAPTLPASGCSLGFLQPFPYPQLFPILLQTPLEQPTCPQHFATGLGEIRGAEGWKTSGSGKAAGPWGHSRLGHAAAEAGTR